MGIPQSILWSTEVSGVSGDGLVKSDERRLYDTTILPEARMIAGALNDQVFGALGLRLDFRHESLSVYQREERLRSDAFKRYVEVGIRRSVAARLLGVELPPGVDFDDLD